MSLPSGEKRGNPSFSGDATSSDTAFEPSSDTVRKLNSGLTGAASDATGDLAVSISAANVGGLGLARGVVTS